MRRPHGYAICVGDEGPPLEWDTITCCHCQRIVHMSPNSTDSGGWCFRCGDGVCGPCADHGVCLPWEKQLELIERKACL